MTEQNQTYLANLEMMYDLLRSLGEIIPLMDLKQINMFLDNREPGIAFQELCGSIVENEISINENQKHMIETLFDRMEGNKNDFWQEINLSQHIKNMKLK